MPDHSPDSRRRFFRQLLLRGIESAEQAGRQIGQAVGARPQPASSAPAPAALPLRYLRPPGALPQPLFSQTCSQCGHCVAACPANCIELDTTGGANPVADGLPYIVPRRSPCVVCDDLSCMKVCPSGALELVDHIEQIDMGVAVVRLESCLRGESGHRPGSSQGEDCRICVTHCPLGEQAIGIDQAGRIQVKAGCIGCGVCERDCPTEPASIVIKPRP